MSADNCPQDRWGLTTDRPSDTFTPRQKESESYRIDFHRGVDLPAPLGSPIFAIASGRLYRDPSSFTCKKTGSTGGQPNRHAFTHLRHMSSTVWNKLCANETDCNVNVTKAMKIGASGAGHSEFPHLHFEIRDAPMYDNCSSNWQADCINPYRVLPYNRSDAIHSTNITVSATGTAVSSDKPQVSITFYTSRMDWNKVEVTMKNGSGAVVGTYQTPVDGYGQYNVEPNFFDIELWNRQWSHKNSQAAPWSSFGLPASCSPPAGAGVGNYSCPYYQQHNCTYNANTHVENKCWDNPSAGCFNGIRYLPFVFNNASTHQGYAMTFNLTKSPLAAVTCVQARLYASGSTTPFGPVGTWGSCL
ncbi:hypothetical protein HYH03_013842 [Edaphochlamys debaryana]|uniref:M23ase beta-sheet core domain-containing protein n=1 Tax=Edaphochlamys debaryana TaxID=47281 RepID=A0A835XNZ7_9CHLO|nr:hypothetical protein HYH03_013842 [Edaphochlamys debaryana]|eukprot:KAG2487563.1 hypothetical protein HYH03_013842 [Edaphochlamys debaryana]